MSVAWPAAPCEAPVSWGAGFTLLGPVVPSPAPLGVLGQSAEALTTQSGLCVISSGTARGLQVQLDCVTRRRANGRRWCCGCCASPARRPWGPAGSCSAGSVGCWPATAQAGGGRGRYGALLPNHLRPAGARTPAGSKSDGIERD